MEEISMSECFRCAGRGKVGDEEKCYICHGKGNIHIPKEDLDNHFEEMKNKYESNRPE